MVLVVKHQFVGAPTSGAIFGILPALVGKIVLLQVALFVGLGVANTLPHRIRHVVHDRGGDGLDSRVDGRCGQDVRAKTTDANRPNSFAVNEGLNPNKVNGCGEVFHEDIRGGHVTNRAGAFTGGRLIEGQGDKPAFGQRLGVKSTGLFLYGSERSGNHDSRVGLLVIKVKGKVEVAGQGKAVPVVKADVLNVDGGVDLEDACIVG